MLGTLVAFAGGLIKNPWKPVVPTAEGKKAVLWTSGWTPRFKGETIFMARATGNAGPDRRSSRCAPRTSTQAAWRRCSRGGSPTATAPRSNRTTDSTRSRWVSATR